MVANSPVRLNPLSLLERNDKWYLGSGNAALYAPAFPKWLDVPGFWDEAFFADIQLDRLFCILLLDSQGRPLHLSRAVRRWSPDCLTQIYTVAGSPFLQIREERVVTPDNTFASKLTFTNDGAEPTRVNLILWSLQQSRELKPVWNGDTVAEVERDLDCFSFAWHPDVGASDGAPAQVYGWGAQSGRPEQTAKDPALYVALGGSRLPDSWTVNLAEASDTAPFWELSILPEKFHRGTLAHDFKPVSGWNRDGLLHLLQHYVIETPPGEAETITLGASVALTRDAALDALRNDMSSSVTESSRNSWQAWFDSVPYFQCSDPFLERYYWYRWYGLRLLTVDLTQQSNKGNPTHQLPLPFVTEGIGGFRSQISYSAQCHIRELAWKQDPALAMGSLENFLAGQICDEEDPRCGWLHGHLYLWRQPRGFYHADWGAAALQIYHMTGDLSFVRRVYPGLCRYARYFDRVRDREQSGLYDVIDQGETGQEYMSRYLFVDESADTWRTIQVKGVDATCYLYSLQRTLAVFARVLGAMAEAKDWDERADITGDAVCETMWDEEERLFKDVRPDNLERSPYKAAVGFYPFLTDIGSEDHLAAWSHLSDPKTFGSPYPIPASSMDDPFFDPASEWKGKRSDCPWNGRVWPMTTSHVAEALAHSARTLDSNLRETAADFIVSYIRMLFFDGDPKRPNAFEHYNPFTGMPCLYRGIDDYQHSWIIHLIMGQVVGIQTEPGPGGKLVVDPLPFQLNHFQALQVPIRGHLIDVVWDSYTGLEVRVDGEVRAHSDTLCRLEVAL